MTLPAVPTTAATWREWLTKVSTTLNEVLRGRLNVVGTFTLSASMTSSTLTDDRISLNSIIVLSPTTANAAAELGNGTLFVSESGRNNGSVVITHANNAQTDRTFRFAIIG
jgi:hypothetical protein